MASTYLARTPGTVQTSRYKGTLSVWIKRAKTDEEDFILNGFESSSNQIKITFKSDAKLQINTVQAGSNRLIYETNRLFRDTSAWYHIVIAIDTTLATAGDRCRLYVNGVEETSFSTETHFSQNDIHFLTENNFPVYIGSQQGTTNYFDGCMAHYHLIDGTQYAASDFGETDSTTGIWKPKTNPSVTYGSHGFFLDFADSSAMGNDVSGNNNDLTVSGTITQTIDTPSNVFATWNRLASHNNSIIFSNGNTTGQSPFTGGFAGIATLGMQDGKYYMECKLISEGASNESVIGVGADLEQDDLSGYIQGQAQHFGIRNNGLKYENGTQTNSVHGSFTTGDIIGMAFDGATKKLTFSKNGGWWNGTSTWTGTSPDFTTHYIDCSGGSYDTFFFEIGDAGSTVNAKWSANFGNGYFGTTAVSSAGTNSGIGTFEYDVPSGYKALCTKNINEQEYS